MRGARSWRLLFSLLLVVVMSIAWVPTGSAGPKSVGEQVRLQLLAINDLHGQITTYSKTTTGTAVGGAALLAGFLDQREAEAKLSNTDTWRLGVGDLVGASPPASALLQDEPTMQVLDEMDFDYSTVGNHEFDEGLAELLRLQYGGFSGVTGHWEGTHMQYLAANVVREDTGQTIFPSYAIKYARGIPVGIIGVVYRGTPGIVTASGVAGLEFLDEAECVNECVDVLKARGVETIIVLLHNGGTKKADGTFSGEFVPVVEAMDDEVDVVLSGHSHATYTGVIDGKLVTQGYSAGRAFADVDLVLDRESGDVVSKSADTVLVRSDPGTPAPNEKVAAIVDAAVAKVAPVINRVIGAASTAITRAQNPAGESALGNLVADAQRWKQGTQIAVTNPGGVRADLDAGEVTWGELFAIQPFSNYLVTMKMTGAQLDDMLERQWLGQTSPRMLQISGMSYTWSASAPAGAKVDPASILVGGVSVKPDTLYTVTANNFLADGGDSFATFKSAIDKLIFGTDLDALVEYVAQLPQPFSASIEGRATVIP